VSLVDPRVLATDLLQREQGFTLGREMKELALHSAELGRPVYLSLFPQENRVQVNTVCLERDSSSKTNADVPSMCLLLSTMTSPVDDVDDQLENCAVPSKRPIMLRSVNPWLEQSMSSFLHHAGFQECIARDLESVLANRDIEERLVQLERLVMMVEAQISEATKEENNQTN